LVIKTLDPEPDPDQYSALYAGSGSGINESRSETLFKITCLFGLLQGFDLYVTVKKTDVERSKDLEEAEASRTERRIGKEDTTVHICMV
jgi:hypothetical protein